jgi:hypothetical protein
MGMDSAKVLNPEAAQIVLTTAESIPPDTPTTKLSGFFAILEQ